MQHMLTKEEADRAKKVWRLVAAIVVVGCALVVAGLVPLTSQFITVVKMTMTR